MSDKNNMVMNPVYADALKAKNAAERREHAAYTAWRNVRGVGAKDKGAWAAYERAAAADVASQEHFDSVKHLQWVA